jgi:hypothetical protein
LTACALGFIAWTAWRLAAAWQPTTVSIDPLLLGLAFAFALGGTFWVAVAWVLLVQRFAKVRVPFVHSLRIYARAALGKYIPGKLAQPVLRLTGLAPYGMTPRLLATSMALEILSWCATGSALALLLGHAGNGLALGGLGLVIAAACLVGLLVLVAVRSSRYPAVLRRWIGVEHDDTLLPWTVPLAHLVTWLFWGAHGALLARALGLGGATALVDASALFVVAPIAGFLALPLPAGVGVRESVVALGLTPLLGPANATAASLLSRLASLVADLGLWLLFVRKGRGLDEPD